MEESCSTFMVVQVECRTDALQKFGAAFKGDKVQQLLMLAAGRQGQSPVGRKVQPANCTDMQIPSCSFTVSENWYIGLNSIMRQQGSIIAFDGSMINRISFLWNELRVRGIYALSHETEENIWKENTRYF